MEDCLYPECTRPRSLRGLCHKHYARAAYYVMTQRTTWNEMEARGSVLPKAMGNRGIRGAEAKFFLGKEL